MTKTKNTNKNDLNSEDFEDFLDIVIESFTRATEDVQEMCNDIRQTLHYFEENRKKGIYPNVG